MVRGLVGTFFQRPDAPRRDYAPVPLTLAPLLLFHRGFDGRIAVRRGYAPVKTACESEQRRERERCKRLKTCKRRQLVVVADASAESSSDSSRAQRPLASDVVCSIRYRNELVHRPAAPSARAPESACLASTLKKNLCLTHVSQRSPVSRTDVQIGS